MPDASLHTMTRIRTTLYNQQIRSSNYRAATQVPRGLSLATIGANYQGNNKILQQDSYIIPDSPLRRSPTLSFPGPSYLIINTFVSIPINNTGGLVDRYLAPSGLPTGLVLNSATGVITGTPTALTSSSLYYITGVNAFGSDTIAVSLQVGPSMPIISYEGAPFTFTKGVYVSRTMTNTGGPIVSVSGALPVGLTLDTATGSFSGTPTEDGSDVYAITATNASGSNTFLLQITVNLEAPYFAYPIGNPILYQYMPITPIVPVIFRGTPTFSASSLPPGLSINSTTGAITGTPTVLDISGTIYPIQGSNITGTHIQNLTPSVRYQWPNISYSPSSYIFVAGIPITDIPVINTGGPISSFGIQGQSLPGGLTLNTSTGTISGTPSGVSVSQEYVVLADGPLVPEPYITVSTGITIRVDPPAPVISYSSPQTYFVGISITPLLPTSTGGTVASYSLLTGLPSGLSLNTSTGAITGTPTSAGSGDYLVRASNVTGTSTATIRITI